MTNKVCVKVKSMLQLLLHRMELEYDSRGRISTQKLLVGRTSSMERITYSADGHVLEVVGTSDWKFVYDENGNVVSIMEQGQKLTLGYDSGDRVVQVSDFVLSIQSKCYNFLSQTLRRYYNNILC